MIICLLWTTHIFFLINSSPSRKGILYPDGYKKRFVVTVQLLYIFYQRKDSKSFLFSKSLLQSLNPFRNLNTCFLIVTPYLIVLDFCILLPISFLVFFDLFIYSHTLWNFGAWSMGLFNSTKVFIQKKTNNN